MSTTQTPPHDSTLSDEQKAALQRIADRDDWETQGIARTLLRELG